MQVPQRLDSMLVTGQIDNYCRQIGEFAAQSFGKLFLAESLQDEPTSPTTWSWSSHVITDIQNLDMWTFLEFFFFAFSHALLLSVI